MTIWVICCCRANLAIAAMPSMTVVLATRPGGCRAGSRWAGDLILGPIGERITG
jgi:hypothetical protein